MVSLYQTVTGFLSELGHTLSVMFKLVYNLDLFVQVTPDFSKTIVTLNGGTPPAPANVRSAHSNGKEGEMEATANARFS